MKMATQKQQIDFNHWLLRLVAFVIDSIIAYIPAWVIWFFIEPAIWQRTLWGGFSTTPFWAPVVLFPLIAGIIQLLYFVILEQIRGQTIGKQILGFEVRMLNGSQLTFSKLLIRNISKIHGLLVLLDWLLGIVTVGTDNRQKFLDRAAGTTVISIKQPFASSNVPPPPPPPT